MDTASCGVASFREKASNTGLQYRRGQVCRGVQPPYSYTRAINHSISVFALFIRIDGPMDRNTNNDSYRLNYIDPLVRGSKREEKHLRLTIIKVDMEVRD